MTAPAPTAPAPAPAVKPGWQTSEFWLAMAATIGGILAGSFGHNTGAYAVGVALSTAPATYAASRAYVKANAQ